MYFSRRKESMPLPPRPETAVISVSSMNIAVPDAGVGRRRGAQLSAGASTGSMWMRFWVPKRTTPSVLANSV